MPVCVRPCKVLIYSFLGGGGGKDLGRPLGTRMFHIWGTSSESIPTDFGSENLNTFSSLNIGLTFSYVKKKKKYRKFTSKELQKEIFLSTGNIYVEFPVLRNPSRWNATVCNLQHLLLCRFMLHSKEKVKRALGFLMIEK